MSHDEGDCIYKEMVLKARALLDGPTPGHRKKSDYYYGTTLAEALSDGWGSEDVVALYAALGVQWPYE